MPNRKEDERASEISKTGSFQFVIVSAAGERTMQLKLGSKKGGKRGNGEQEAVVTPGTSPD
jgi:hypothetical protein